METFVDARSKPPPIYGPEDADAFTIEVRDGGDYVMVEARFTRNGTHVFSINTGYPEAYVEPPNALMRLLGDTLEGRIERAKWIVAWKARRLIEKCRRVHEAVEATR